MTKASFSFNLYVVAWVLPFPRVTNHPTQRPSLFTRQTDVTLESKQQEPARTFVQSALQDRP